MKGLILKDLLLAKNNVRLLIAVFFFFLIMSFTGSLSVTFIIPIFCMLVCINTFSYDEYNKWDAYAISLPGSRKNIVRSKYFSSILIMILGFILSLLLVIILCNVKSSIFIFDDQVSGLIGSFVGLFFALMILYPFFYKFGVQKGRIYLFVVVAIFTTVCAYLEKSVDKPMGLINFINNYEFIIIPMFTIITTYISYIVSLKIYSKKEF